MEFRKIRESIVDNKIDKAIEDMTLDDHSEFKDKLLLLKNQYNTWQKEQHQNLRPPSEERNRIIYALLCTVTQIEKESTKGKKFKKLEELEKAEDKLSKAFEEIAILKQNGTVDLFMLWLQEKHSDLFSDMKRQEQEMGNTQTFNLELAKLDLGSYLKKVENNISETELKEYILNKHSQIPSFFTKWELYHKRRRAQASRLKNTVKILGDEHQKILRNLFGGIFGGIVSNLLFKKLETLVSEGQEDETENGSPGPDPFGDDDQVDVDDF